MFINELSDEELLQLAQATLSLPKDVYETGKSSVFNYYKLYGFVKCNQDTPTKRVPLEVCYSHYLDWLKDNYPHILPHDHSAFNAEITQLLPVIVKKNVMYLLIFNAGPFRKYRHTYNEYLITRKRKANNKASRKRNKK